MTVSVAPKPSIDELRAAVTNARLCVNDFYAARDERDLEKWRTAQLALIDAAKALGRAEAAIDKRQRYLEKRRGQSST